MSEFERMAEQLKLMKAGEVIGEVNTAVDNLLEQIPERPEMSLERTVASLSLSIFAASNAMELATLAAVALLRLAGVDTSGAAGSEASR